MWLGSGIAMAMAQASSYSSDLTPNLDTSICCGCGPRKDKKTKKKILRIKNTYRLKIKDGRRYTMQIMRELEYYINVKQGKKNRLRHMLETKKDIS